MMEMQGNVTEIDERNLLQLDALLSTDMDSRRSS